MKIEFPFNNIVKAQAADDKEDQLLKDKNGKTLQYVGIAVLLISYILATVVVNFSGPDFFTENIIMVIAMSACVVLAALGYLTISIVVMACSIVCFAAFKIFSIMTNTGAEEVYSPASFLWMILPVGAVVGIVLFLKDNSGLILENALLRKQISELVMTDPLTGLYNIRSMYMDIQTQISYSERNDIPISLMILRLRYPVEMKKVLKKKEFENVIKQLSVLIQDTVRLEDRVYSLDSNGGFAIILTCDQSGTKTVEKRLRGKLADPSWFANISDRHQIRAEVKIGCLQYDKNRFVKDAKSFKDAVEDEVDFDI